MWLDQIRHGWGRNWPNMIEIGGPAVGGLSDASGSLSLPFRFEEWCIFWFQGPLNWTHLELFDRIDHSLHII